MARTQQVSSAQVERLGLGHTQIDGRTFRALVSSAVKPFVGQGMDRPHPKVEAQMRKGDVRRRVLEFLNETGDLFPTE